MKNNTGTTNPGNTDFETVPVGTMDKIDKLKIDLEICNKLLDVYRKNITLSGDTNLLLKIQKDLSEINQQEVFVKL